MGRDPNLEHLGGLNLNFRAISIQKVVVGEMASTDHRCTGGGELDPLVWVLFNIQVGRLTCQGTPAYLPGC